MKFISGNSRLQKTVKIEYYVSSLSLGSQNPDCILPQAHTCSQQIDIPHYSSFEIMKKNIKYAIEHCIEYSTDDPVNNFIPNFDE